MGNNIRIGKDFNVQWAINKVVDGERLPYDLVGKELQLYIVNDNGRKEVAGWKVQGNVIEWTFLGKDQRRLGAYQLILVENAGKEGMVTVDTCKAFNLVAHSCEEDVDGGSDVVIKTVVLESEVALAPVVKEGASYDDTEIKEDLAKLQQNKEDKINKVTSLSDESTDVQYPSAKTVYDLIKRLEERIVEQDQFIEDLQNTKIEKENDDYYPKMAVGLADNLAGVDVVDSEINFRRSGGGAITDGVARIESIKGNSVVWNQMVDNANTALFKNGNTNGVLSVEGDAITLTTTTEGTIYAYYRTQPFMDSLIVGHKYLRICELKKSSNALVYVRMQGIQGDSDTTLNTNDTWSIVSNFFTITEKTSASPFFQFIIMVAAVGDYISFRKTTFVDLTKMFGAGNEPTTIEEFYARIPMGVDMNAYNEGEVIHMDVQSIESQGANAWDEEWESGGFSTTDGSKTIGGNFIRSANYIPVIGGMTYKFTGISGKTCYAWLYGRDKNFIKYTSVSSTLAIPTDVAYMMIRLGSSSAPITAYNHDICINISDTSINGKYFPYIKRVEDLSLIRKYFPQGMKSAGSAHDEIRYNKASGKRESKDALIAVKMKDLTWGGSTQNNYTHAIRAALNVGQASGNNVMCRRFVRLSGSPTSAWLTDSNPYTIVYYNGYIGVNDPAYTDVNAFIASLTDNDILYIERAEPIVTELDAEDQFKDLDYQVWNAGTEKANAEGKSAPLAADITYGFNAIGKIKELESLVAALRAKVGI